MKQHYPPKRAYDEAMLALDMIKSNLCGTKVACKECATIHKQIPKIDRAIRSLYENFHSTSQQLQKYARQGGEK